MAPTPEERIRKLREALRYHEERYYIFNAPEISDEAFDRLLHERARDVGNDRSRLPADHAREIRHLRRCHRPGLAPAAAPRMHAPLDPRVPVVHAAGNGRHQGDRRSGLRRSDPVIRSSFARFL